MNNKDMKNLIKKARKFAKPFRVTDDKFRLKDIDPGDTLDFTSEDKPRAKEALAMGVDVLGRASGHALRAGQLGGVADLPGDGRRGKRRRDQARHVRRQPAGLPGFLFQVAHERRTRPRLPLAMHKVPARARSHRHFQPQLLRGDLVVRVHREFLDEQKLPPDLITKDIWKERFQDIRSFERYLTRNGVAIRKFFLHVSNKEQKKRFPRAHRGARKKLEIFRQRRQGAPTLGRLYGSLRRHDPEHRDKSGAVVHRAGGQQMVYPRRCRRRRRRSARLTQSQISESE